MQLKGLVRFFTILLILYSVYELSFTWVVRSHEKKMESQAKQYVSAINPQLNDQQILDSDIYKSRLRRLLDSTKDETVHFGINGAVSYQKAKEEELNLGLDLQGGINVTLEVELGGLLRAMANNTKDVNFNKAIENANVRKANSSADFITLFVEEYRKLSPNSRLAPLFSTANQDRIKVTDEDSKVISEVRREAGAAFDRTFNVLRNRIDQFGVASPNINPDPDRGTITVELPGIQDQERVRRYLQSSANLEFWEVYKNEELQDAWMGAETAYAQMMGSNQPATAQTEETTDTSTATDTSGANTDTSSVGVKLSEIQDTNKATADTSLAGRRSFMAEFFKNGFGLVSINDTAIFRELLNSEEIRSRFPADAMFAYGIPPRLENNKQARFVPIYVLKTNGRDTPPMEGSVVTSSDQSFDQFGKPSVSMDISAVGSRLWEKLTRTSFEQKRPIAILLDDVVYSAPIANNGPITGGRTEISGDFTIDEAKDLANILKAGKLPAPAKIVQEQVVGPTLGADAIQGGMLAFLISFIVIFLLMLVYYSTSGWVANIALTLNILFTIGILTGLGATLTAPGIAGLVLTIGMAVDVNVIIYERIKEELTNGKTYLAAINEGYKRSLPPVLDGHITTLITAVILFSFGLGPVKGFATTQIIGLLLSMFCGILVSRWVTTWFTSKNKHLEYFTPVSRKLFKNAKYKFVEKRKYAYAISVIILLLGIGSVFNGFDQGVEFKGGRSYIVNFGKDIRNDVEQIREDLATTFEEAPVIKTIGGNNQLDITTSYEIENTSDAADSLVVSKLHAGLQPHLPAGTDLQTFTSTSIMGSSTVLPTISDDLKEGALWATFWALVLISIYIFARFRDWRYSLGTLMALFHDVIVVLIVFSFFRHIVPFPLELDQHFIAAILTVIGFSMNDTVVIFDRIREFGAKMVGASKGEIINKAINDTISRTIMTSLTVFLVLLILFLFGGQVTKGFAFAMLIGVITGVYSSVFVGAPVLVDLGKKKDLAKISDSPDKESTKKTKPIVARH